MPRRGNVSGSSGKQPLMATTGTILSRPVLFATFLLYFAVLSYGTLLSEDMHFSAPSADVFAWGSVSQD